MLLCSNLCCRVVVATVVCCGERAQLGNKRSATRRFATAGMRIDAIVLAGCTVHSTAEHCKRVATVAPVATCTHYSICTCTVQVPYNSSRTKEPECHGF